MSYNGENRVCITKQKDYSEQEVFKVIDSQFQKLGVYDQLKPGMKVLLKPNLLMESKPGSVIITHPAVTLAAAMCVKKAGAQIIIAESSGGPYIPARMKRLFSVCGYTEIAEKTGAQLYTDCESREVKLPKAKLCRSTSVVEPFLSADYIINICKLKTHGMMGMSGAVKNMFGAVPGLMKPELHCRFPEKPDFAAMIVDLCEFLKPNLNIMDAVEAMEGNGPTSGEMRFVGAILSAYNPYALDLAGSQIISAVQKDLPILCESIERGFIDSKPSCLEIIGDSLDELCVKDYKPAKSASADFISKAPQFLRPVLGRLARPTPKVNAKRCIGCGKCAESCPQHIIEIKTEIKSKKAEIMPKDCIRCFCCHEMCPVKAIDVKRWAMFSGKADANEA